MDNNGEAVTTQKKAVTQEDIARELRMSRKTVSLALNHDPSVTPATARLVHDKARELGYTRLVDRDASRSIGVIVPYLGPPVYSELLRHLREALVANDYLPVIIVSGGVVRDEIHVLSELRHMDMAGFILLSPRMRIETIEREASPRQPLVSISGPPSRSLDDGYRSVSSDSRLGAFKAVKHLTDSGYRKVAYLSGPSLSISNDQRLQGYKDALEDAEIPFDDTLIIEALTGPVAAFQWPTLDNGYRQFKELTSRGTAFDSVIAYNDEMAIGVLRALNEVKKQETMVPVVGYDNAPIGEYSNPRLTSVGPHWNRVALTAAELLLSMLGETTNTTLAEPHISIEPQLIIRESTVAMSSKKILRRGNGLVARRS